MANTSNSDRSDFDTRARSWDTDDKRFRASRLTDTSKGMLNVAPEKIAASGATGFRETAIDDCLQLSRNDRDYGLFLACARRI